MACNDVKYYPEKDADSYYARPRSESLNPSEPFSLSLSLSYPRTCREMLTCHFHWQSVTRAVQRGRGAPERAKKKEYLLHPFFVSICVSSLKINLRLVFLPFFSPPRLVPSSLDLICRCREIIITYNSEYEFINLQRTRYEGWEVILFSLLLFLSSFFVYIYIYFKIIELF